MIPHKPVCLLCLQEGVVNSEVVDKLVPNPMHEGKLLRSVCVTCLERGRDTPATCRSFGRVE